MSHACDNLEFTEVLTISSCLLACRRSTRSCLLSVVCHCGRASLGCCEFRCQLRRLQYDVCEGQCWRGIPTPIVFEVLGEVSRSVVVWE